MSYRSELTKRRGRPPRFETAEDIWTEFCAYIEFTDKFKIDLPTHVVKGSNREEGRGGQVSQPLTFDGFMAFCGIGRVWSEFAHYQCERGADFCEVISRVRNIVRTDQLAGGMAGVYNSNLTARLNGLVERQDYTSEGKQVNIIIPSNDGKHS